MAIEIRPGRIEDIPEVHACLDVVARERHFLAFLEAPPLEASRAWWRGIIEKGSPFVLAVDDARAVGWCDIAPEPRPVHSHAGILGIGLLPDYRGRGIGRRLLAAAIEDARRSGLERIELNVYERNLRARRLYESMGFVVEGARRRHHKLEGAYQDSILMARLL
jgi:RimJ/RimL family protein N-acetyltransferase